MNFFELSFPLCKIRININIHKIKKFMFGDMMKSRDKKFELKNQHQIKLGFIINTEI